MANKWFAKFDAAIKELHEVDATMFWIRNITRVPFQQTTVKTTGNNQLPIGIDHFNHNVNKGNEPQKSIHLIKRSSNKSL